MLTQIIILSFIGGVFSLIGGGILLSWRGLARRTLIHLTTFAAGALLGAAFLDIFPEGLEAFEEAGIASDQFGLAVLAGILAFFIIERLLLKLHSHEPDDGGHLQKTPWLLIVGDSLHNFADGIAIATAYLIEPSVGLVTALAVAAHEVPSEIGEFSVMLRAGWTKRKVLVVNVGSAFSATAGAIVTYLSRGIIEPFTPWILAVTAGVFIYIAASDLIPEIHHQTQKDKASHVISLLMVGVIVVGLISYLLE